MKRSLAMAFLLFSITFPAVVYGGNSKVILLNKFWKKGVVVNVRVGDSGDPMGNEYYGTKTVKFEKKWTIKPKGGSQVCYRREVDPYQKKKKKYKGPWTPWKVISVFPGKVYEETIR